MALDIASAYRGARVLVTGGAGFIGSALAARLVALGAEVVLADSFYEEGGANLANIRAIRDRVTIATCDIRDADALVPLVVGRQYLFNLAARTSHMGSLAEPLADLDVNGRAQLALLELCRSRTPGITIVFASTRQIYGTPDRLPVDKSHPLRPPDPNGVSKLAGEAYHLLYHRLYGLATVALRLTNTYGPGMRIKDAKQTFLGIWIRQLLEHQPLEVWGGAQRRDLTYVEDVATAFLLAGVAPDARGRAFNIGAERAPTLAELAQLLIAANGGGSFAVKEFPPERRRIDIGDYAADDSAFRALTDWQPEVALADGLARTLAYFRDHRSDYL